VVSLNIQFGHIGVPVIIGTGPGFEQAADKAIRALDPDRVLVLADATVAQLYAADVQRFAALGRLPGVVHVAPAGEACKTLSNVEDVAETFMTGGATKQSLVLVFGGGATMNLGGLTAALMYRGLRLCHVPTTLMAQNDVVPSMKTAVNLCGRKNNFGTFHPATLNVIDTRYLHSLPVDELRSGMGELVKNALILGGEHAALVERIPASVGDLLGDEARLAEMVETGIRAKLPALAADAQEATTGMIFEYGHTVGHALELAYAPGTLPHGLAICWGMRCCSFIASRLGLMPPAERQRHDALIGILLSEDLPRPLPSLSDVMFRVMRDSKRGRVGEAADEVSCVLLTGVGRPIPTPSMLSKFPASLVSEWLREQGFRD
jgi:3-dehydroquinate synthetase